MGLKPIPGPDSYRGGHQFISLMSYGRTYGGGNRFGGGGFGPKPVETGKEYEVQITEMSRQGDGIARVQGFVIFVKGAKIGQKSKVKITNVGARFATAELVAAPENPQETQSPQ
jgi:predicted RNA-binding protein with TRAM domain